MKVHFGGRVFLAAAMLGAVVLMAAGFFAALAIRSALADPGGPVPNPGHAWSENEGHGEDADALYVSTENDEAFEVRVNNARALRLEPNPYSPNVIGGYSGNSVTSGVFGAAICGGGASGNTNRVTDDYGTVAGGYDNQAGDNAGTTTDAPYATVDGGYQNTASDDYAAVGGGYMNGATALSATVGGGYSNDATALAATVGGGYNNAANAQSATVGGGYNNTASAYNATVCGGFTNLATADFGVVGGGQDNVASATYATVGGGRDNVASAEYAAIAGGGRTNPFDPASGNRVTDNYGTVCGGGNNQAGDNAGLITDVPYATVAGGKSNTASADYAAVGGGYSNTANANYSSIGGGDSNLVIDDYGTVGGGYSNQAGVNDGNPASQYYATIAGGFDNTAGGQHATIGGGWANSANGTRASVGGGYSNDASGYGSTIPGGFDNTATGMNSFAAGRQAKADHQGAFVWADSTAADFASLRDDQFRVRADGGARFDDGTRWVEIWDDGTDLITTSTGAHLTRAGVWTDSSDRHQKENFTPVDGSLVLARLADMPITTWNHKAEDPSTRHMGPTAQDFYAAFGLGGSDTSIATLDSSGVALAAIQGLYEIVQDLQTENADLKARVTALERGAPPERGSESLPSSLTSGGWLLLIGLLVLGGLVVAQRRLAGDRR